MGAEKKTSVFLWVIVLAAAAGSGYGLKLAGEQWLERKELIAGRAEAARFARSVVLCTDGRPLPGSSSWAPKEDADGLESFDVWDEDAFRCSGIRGVETPGTRIRWELLSEKSGRVLLQSSATGNKWLEVKVACDARACRVSSHPTQLISGGDGV